MSSKNKPKIPDPKAQAQQATHSKFRLGVPDTSLNEVRQFTLVFAFDYCSTEGSDLCSNSNLIELRDYHKLFKRLKALSTVPIEELARNRDFHFHPVDLADESVGINERMLFDALQTPHKERNPDHLPTLYQFKVFEEARLLGFLHGHAFHLIWFDRNHRVYKRK